LKKIGVFDSGIGGLSVAHAIEKALPDHQVIFVSDSQHVPYGTRTIDEIESFVVPILEDLEAQGCDVIVVACNTVSTNLIEKLRTIIKIPLIAMEPMVKPAAEQTKSKVIAICATPRTLSSRRYEWLKDTYAKGVKVEEPDCSDWMLMIETDQVDREKIKKRIDAACNEGADVIVLGCTHFHWIEKLIKEIAAGRATVLQPEEPVIKQLKRVLAQLS
jgi:glutamate racemase